MSLSDAAVLRSIVRARLVTPDQLWSALEASDARPLADVLRERGLLDEEKVISNMADTLVGSNVIDPGSDATVKGGSKPERETVRRAAPTGKRVGKFLLESKLGEGGMGEVWKAVQVDLGRVVALKMVLRASDEDLARFRREAQLAASLQHPNIIQVYEVGEADNRPYLAMQYVQGQTLAGVRLPLRRTLEILRDASEAVHHAHLRGVIHRDIKPHNIMLDSTGKVFVMDFGLARPEQKPGEGLTVSGELLGTPSYMAPEQTRALAHLVGPATDVWALGVTLYELVTGAKPFEAPNIGELFSRIQSSAPVAPHRLVPRLERDVETIILKCIEKDPARRYQSAGELAADLARQLRGDAILARRPGRLERLWRIGARNPGIVAAAAFCIVALVPFIMWRSQTDKNLHAQLAAAQRSGNMQRVAELTEKLSSSADTRVEATEAATAARDAALERANKRDAAEFVAVAARLERDDAIAAFALALGLEPSNRAARSGLAALLPKGAFADSLLGPVPGEGRLDIDAPEGWTITPRVASLPFVLPGKYTVTAGEVRCSVEVADAAWIRLRLRAPERIPDGFHFVPDTLGRGCFVAKSPEIAASWEAATAAAKARGGRLATRGELEALRGVLAKQPTAEKLPGSPPEWTMDRKGAVYSGPGSSGEAKDRVWRLVTDWE